MVAYFLAKVFTTYIQTMIKFLLLVNKQGQPRVIRHYEYMDKKQRVSEEQEVIRKCLLRSDKECNFFVYKSTKIIYRKYATLFFILGVDDDENELAVLEFLHNIVEAFDQYFERVCEMDIMFNLDRVNMILDEMISNGLIIESNRTRILAPMTVIDHVVSS